MPKLSRTSSSTATRDFSVTGSAVTLDSTSASLAAAFGGGPVPDRDLDGQAHGQRDHDKHDQRDDAVALVDHECVVGRGEEEVGQQD